MNEGPWTVRRLLTWTTRHFERRSVDAPRLTSELLLAHVLGLTRVRLYTDLDRPLEQAELGSLRALIERRTAGEPVQYLTGIREFSGRPFRVDPRVLIPRPETELLVDEVVSALRGAAAPRLVDVGTGSGCIAVTLAQELPGARVLATDVDPDACAVARANAEALGVGGRVEIRQGELLDPVADQPPFDAVVSNPPYVRSGDLPGLQREVRREPARALDGGPDGLHVIRRLLDAAFDRLAPEGLLALEIGEDQGDAVRDLLVARGYERVRIARDLERRERMAFGTRPRG